jgi:hypothetical protein
MERSAWSDARLDDRFDHIDGELAALRADFRGLRGEFAELRGEMHQGFIELRGEINDLRLMMFRGWLGMMVALAGVIAAILARGV